jgi:hypothetical protein
MSQGARHHHRHRTVGASGRALRAWTQRRLGTTGKGRRALPAAVDECDRGHRGRSTHRLPKIGPRGGRAPYPLGRRTAATRSRSPPLKCLICQVRRAPAGHRTAVQRCKRAPISVRRRGGGTASRQDETAAGSSRCLCVKRRGWHRAAFGM